MMEDEFINEQIKERYLRNKDFINKRRLGLIPPRKRKLPKDMGHHKPDNKTKGECPRCKKVKYLARDYWGKKMCQECLWRSF